MKMYENKFKNEKSTGIEDLDNFLTLIADADEDIELFAIGGTAMTLKNIKLSTKDIDFLTTSTYDKIKRIFTLSGLKEISSSKQPNIWRWKNSIRIDIFYGEFIMGITLPDDCIKSSILMRKIGKIKLFILNWYDIIITKIARSEERDLTDVLAIIKTQKIDLKKLKKRYFDLAPISLISDYKIKYDRLEWRLK